MKYNILTLLVCFTLGFACVAPISQAQYSQNGYGNQRHLVLEKEGNSFGVAMLKSLGSVFAISLLACAGLMIWKFLIIGLKEKQSKVSNTYNIFKNKWSNNNLNNNLSNSSTVVSEDEENAYELAQQEIDDGTLKKGLWAKAQSESLGDEKKTSALYLRYRKDQLLQVQRNQREIEQAELRQKNLEKLIYRNEIILFNCPKCGAERRSVKQSLIDKLLSQKKPSWKIRCGSCKNVLDLRDIIPELRNK